MGTLTPEELEEQKRVMYEGMTPRRRKFVDRIGFDKWDPFPEPFDPIDIRVGELGVTAPQLSAAFLNTRPEKIEGHYAAAINELCVLLVGNKERVRPIFDFCVWYAEELEKRNKSF